MLEPKKHREPGASALTSGLTRIASVKEISRTNPTDKSYEFPFPLTPHNIQNAPTVLTF
jgi:hypothetical protein